MQQLNSDPNAKITVWTDSVHRLAVDAYIQAHPDKAGLIEIACVNRGQFPDKVLEFNRANRGWPDLLFAEPPIVARASDTEHHFPLDLFDWIPAEILQKITPGSLEACTIAGKLVCLRYDTSQMVLYYNQPLMAQFGYPLPTTWEEYQALSDEMAAQHPGYLMGAFGDGWGFRTYFTASGCAFSEILDANQVRINLADAASARAASLVDHMLANGTLSRDAPFSPGFINAARQNKILMMVAAAWYGEYAFGGKPTSTYYRSAAHQLGVALPPRWADQAKPVVDAQGGAAWAISSHTRNPQLAADIILWTTTSIEALSTGPDWPAYLPAAAAWGKQVAASPLYANDPTPVYQATAEMISPQNNEPRYDTLPVLDEIVQQAASQNKKMVELLPVLQKRLETLATRAGYQVITR
jgi:multiple sugar transport system substrate-binding protein